MHKIRLQEKFIFYYYLYLSIETAVGIHPAGDPGNWRRLQTGVDGTAGDLHASGV